MDGQDTRQKLYKLIMQTLAEELSECDGNEKAKGKAKEKPKKKPKKRDAWHRGTKPGKKGNDIGNRKGKGKWGMEKGACQRQRRKL